MSEMTEQKEAGKKTGRGPVSLKSRLALNSLILAVLINLCTIAMGAWLGTRWADGAISKSLFFLTAAAFWVVSGLIAFFAARITTGRIAGKIEGISGQMASMGEGSLKSAEYSAAKIREVDELGESLKLITKRLNTYISDFEHSLRRITQSDLDFELDGEYVGYFNRMKDSMNEIIRYLNGMMLNFRQESGHILSIAEQMSSTSQNLAQGATEQAGAVEELLSTVHEISSRVSETADQTSQASEKADLARRQASKSNEQMQSLIGAMDDIQGTSKQVAKIVKIIEDIAFQTNILALNAAVEAARAGVNGRSFAVVADEVKNLATKSASAAADTTNLIKNTIAAVEKGMTLSNTTAHLMSGVAGSVDEMAGIVAHISEATAQESISIQQVVQGLDQVSTVVQSNSASAEESAAVSHELADSAQKLQTTVGAFKLRNQ